jgi:hypothetical protein
VLKPLLRSAVNPVAWATVLTAAAGAGCGEDVTSKPPRLESVAPPFLCRVQQETEVTLEGQSFGPLVTGLPDDGEARLPDITLSRVAALDGTAASSAESTLFSGARGGPNADRVRWDGPTRMRVTVGPSLSGVPGDPGDPGPLASGLYSVRVDDPVRGGSESARALGVVDAPSLATATPGIVCLAEGARTLTLAGAGLLRLGETGPTGTLGEGESAQTLTVERPTGCVEVPHATADGEVCDGGELVLAADALPPGSWPLVLTNPAPADCVSEAPHHVRVVPAPTLSAADPPVTCPTESEQSVVLRGADLLRIDGTPPAVTLTDADGTEHTLVVESMGADCEALETEGHVVEKCTSLTVRLPTLPVGAPYRPNLTVTNPAPAGCHAATTQTLTLVPPPALAAVEPAGTCVAQGERALTLLGEGFLSIDGTLPTVLVDDVPTPVDALTACEPVDVTGLTVERCTSALIRVPEDTATVEPGGFAVPNVDLTNPSPAACSSHLEGGLVVFPPPAPRVATPPLVCLAQGERAVVLTGDGFVTWNDAPPAVWLGEPENAATVVSAEQCVDAPTRGATARICAELQLTLAEGLVPPGRHPLGMRAPEPVGCESEGGPSITVTPAPTLRSANPPVVCAAEGPREVVLTGDDFLRIGEALPSVRLRTEAGDEVELAVTALGGNCAPVEATDVEVERCDSLTVLIPQTDVGTPYQPTLTVTNPAPAGCSAASAEVLTLVPAPQLVAVTPVLVCAADGERVVDLEGTGLLTIDGTWPAFDIEGTTLAPVEASGCTPVPAAGLQVETCATFRVTLTETLPRPPGPYTQPAVTATNPAPAGCSTRAPENALTLVPPPALSAAEPPALCLAQGPRTVRLTGGGLIRVDGASPTVLAGGVEATVTGLDDCQALPIASGQAEHCGILDVELAQDALPAGPAALALLNPEPAGCAAPDAPTLTVLPAPTLEAVAPVVVCPSEGPRDVVLTGTGLVRLDGALPAAIVRDAGGDRPVTVLSVDDCAPLEIPGHQAESCRRVSLTVPQQVLEAPVAPTLVLTNPAPIGCAAESAASLLLVPPPVLDDAGPVVVCREGDEATLALSGRGFIVVGGVPPSVTVNGQAPRAVRPAACTPVAPGVEACDRLDVDVDPAAAADGNATIVVRNPETMGCSAEVVRGVAILAPPRLDAIAPALVCTEDGARSLTLTGANFVELDGRRPGVTVDGVAAVVEGLDGCAPSAAGALAFETCTSMVVSVPGGALGPGSPRVEITGPAPAACTGGADGLVTVPPALTLTEVVPERVCSAAGERQVRITGTGFLVVDGVAPLVSLGGGSFPARGADCAPLAVPGHAVEACTTLDVVIPQGAAEAGPTPVTVTNPAPEGCAESVDGVFQIIPQPRVAAVEPNEICEDGFHELRVTGEGFYADSQVTLGRWPATEVRFIDETTLVATFPEDLEAGPASLTVDNGDGCIDTLPDAVEIHPMPIVFFVDPPVIYNGISLQATVYTSGLDAAPSEVRITGPGDVALVLDARVEPNRPNKVLVTLPGGLAPGEWSVQVTSRIGCVGQLPGGFTVTDRLTLALSNVDPAFVSPSVATAITLRSADPPPAGQTNFLSTPRAYLNPHDGGADVLATAVRALVFVDEHTLTGVVPSGLTPGPYDVVVVNPDGTVGVMAEALTVTADEPPVVTAVEPASLDGNGVQRVRVLGRDFDRAGVTFVMTCRDAATGAETSAGAAAVPGGTDTELQADLPAGNFAAGSICTLTLVNADGASFRYSALSIKTPAQNLSDWTPQTAMVEPRRALGLVAGRPTATSRFLYALGGDAGAVASAKTTVEAASVDTFGEMGQWSLQRHALPAARTSVGATRVGRFLYVVGGHDGSNATSTVYRAQILDPLATPEVSDISLTLRPAAAGMPAGLWHYRIAAVFPADDASNPGGESLPGEVLVADLPAVPGLEMRLEWTPVPGALAYRVYRTPAADAPLATLALLATTAETFHVDTGAAVDPTQSPLPSGSTGVWHAVSSLTVPREAAAIGAAPAPPEDPPGTFYLYAFGGRTTGGTYLASYEYARITVDDAEGQAVGPFVPGAQPLRSARAEGAVFQVTSADLAAVPRGRSWLFVGPGRTANGFSRDVEANEVGPGGDLGVFIVTDSTSNDAAGYAAGAANGFLFIVGGRAGAASDGGVSGELCRSVNDPGCGQAPGEPPDIRNWNALGSRLSEARVFPGSTQESAFFFTAGGFNGNAVVRSVDRTVQ